MNEPILRHARLNGRSGHEAGRQLLRQMYEELTGQPMPEPAIADRGKPYFPGSPWQFSITHTNHHVFCALSRSPVGIDAEEEDRKVNLKLAHRALSPGEFAQWEQAPDQKQALLTFWVLKEARVKCSGEGLRGFPNDTDFRLDDPRVQKIDGCLVAVITGNEA